MIAILGLAFWLRWRFIQAVHLYPDEFVTLLAIEMIKSKGLPIMPSGLFYEHGLLFSYLGSMVSLLDSSYLTVRYVSLLLGLMTIALVFWVGRHWFSPMTGLIAAATLALAPAAIHWSGRVRMYALLQFLVLLTIYLAYEGIIKNQARLRWAALLTYLGATLAHFAAVALAPPLLLASGVILWIKTKRQSISDERLASLPDKVNWRSLCLESLAFIAILTIAFLVKRAGQPKGIEALDPTPLNAVTGFVEVLNIYSDFSFDVLAGWQAISPFYFNLPALIFTPIAVVIGLVCLGQIFLKIFSNGKARAEAKAKSNLRSTTENSEQVFLNPQLATLFLWLILLITTLEMILIVSADRRDDKYLFMLLPVLFLLGAYGLVVIGNWLLVISYQIFNLQSPPPTPPSPISPSPNLQSPNLQSPNLQSPNLQSPVSNLQSPVSNLQSPVSNLQLLITSLIILLLTLLTWPAIQATLTNTGDDYETAFAYVQDNWREGDTIFTGTPAAAAFYLGHNDFYGVQRRGGYDYRLLSIDDQAVDRWLASPAIRTEADLHRTLADHNVWLVLERWGLQREYYDLPFQQQLLAQTQYETESQGVFVLRSKADPQPIALQPTHSAQATFGQVVQLLGYTIEPETPSPGQSLRLTLYWQAIAPMAQDYTVFVHLRQPTGDNVAQADHRPLGNLYPTSIWPVGETIRESSELSLPADLPPGTYELWLGLYLLETGERLPVQNDASGENAVRVGDVTVE